ACRPPESPPPPPPSGDEDRSGRRLLAARARVLEAGAVHAPARRAQAPDQLVERALAAAIASEPDAPQDIGARELGLLPEPLDDRRREARDGRRAAGAPTSGRRRRALVHEWISEQVRYRNCCSRRSATSEAPATMAPISLAPADQSLAPRGHLQS